ncbi:Hcp family type VI secretion system effector [Enterobacter sp. KBR-315C3_2022]|jgi:type VI secretion system effector, Hcp1 family|uniref:Hcp family type VI secretion system effector n=1 Tax=Enterobacter sp. KBR-315C3_2022 TaxID=3242494 RepID=UPI0035271953
MSLPAYMFLYDENGMLVSGACSTPGRLGGVEIMSSSFGVAQPVDSHTGSMTGTRQHHPLVLHKYIDKISPYLAACVCEGRRLQKAVIRFYEINDAGIERELYRITLEGVVIMSVNANHSYIPGSHSANMLETVSIRFRGIEWLYLDGVIKYSDSWLRKQEQ